MGTLSGLGLSGSGRCFCGHLISLLCSWRMKLKHFRVNHKGCIKRITSRSGQGWSFPPCSALLRPLRRAVPSAGLPSPGGTQTLEQVLPRVTKGWGIWPPEERLLCWAWIREGSGRSHPCIWTPSVMAWRRWSQLGSSRKVRSNEIQKIPLNHKEELCYC